jgi:hypothetical protein
MIREEPREFDITTVAQPLLWACLGECPWEKEGYPFHPFKYNVPFWGPPGLVLPRENKTYYKPSHLMHRAVMVVICPFIHRVLFELACFFWWKPIKYLGYKVKRQDTLSVSGLVRVTGTQATVSFSLVLAMGDRRESQCGDIHHCSVSPLGL